VSDYTNIDAYQEWSKETAIYPKESAIEYLTLGLVSEAGEVAGKVKKRIRDGNIKEEEILAELGDVYWYLVRLADEMGVKSSDIIHLNKAKLTKRKAAGTIGGSGDER